MKHYLTYGFGITIANALVTLVLFFTGMHSDASKMTAAGWIGGLFGLATYLIGVVLGIKAVRAEVPLDKPFSYGQALGAALMISLFAIIGACAFNYLYDTVINPSMIPVTLEHLRQGLEAKGLPEDKIDQQMAFMRKMQSPVGRVIFVAIFLAVIDVVMSLIIAGCMTRRDPDESNAL